MFTRRYLKKGDHHQEKVGSMVKGILSHLGFDPKKYALFETWDQEMKKVINGCRAVALKGTEIIIGVPSTSHKQELYFYKKMLLKRVNESMGHLALTDARFQLESETGGSRREHNQDRRWDGNTRS